MRNAVSWVFDRGDGKKVELSTKESSKTQLVRSTTTLHNQKVGARLKKNWFRDPE